MGQYALRRNFNYVSFTTKLYMRLKSLELVGFKSFVDRTVVQFEEGITGVVGPNGSGKSNIVDAIRWVMGEQSAKHLRGGDMQDVIFAGSQKRNPMGMASVFLTFDNADGRAPAEYAQYAEITVGRRLYRSGESEYFINKTPCRLRDIVDLFLGTGTGTKAYSIVEQGQIGRIISSKPEERRSLIEEAAGISKFKNRRDAAQRKMEATKQNLLRLQDIITELERQLNSMERQVKKAEKYKELTAELRKIELAFASHQWTKWKTSLTEVEAKLNNLSSDETGRATELATLETTIEEHRINVAGIEQELSVAQERAYALQNMIHLHEAKITHKTQEIVDTKQRLEKASVEVDGLVARAGQWRDELAAANDSKVTVDMALAQVEENASLLEAEARDRGEAFTQLRNELESLQTAVVEAVQAVSQAESRLENIEKRESELNARGAELSTQKETLQKSVDSLESSLSSDRATLQSQQQLTIQLADERNSVESTLASQQAELARVEQALREQQENLQKSVSRLDSLEELTNNFEGYEEGVKTILREQSGERKFTGVLGTVAEHVHTESRFEAAVGAVLGERIQGIVVESQQDGVAALQYLKNQAKGRGTFIPKLLRERVQSASSVSGVGVVGTMKSFTRFDNEYAAIGDYLVSDVVIVENIESALQLWEQYKDVTFATLNGEVVYPSGILTGGGSGDNAQAILARLRELEDLRPQVARLSSQVEASEQMQSKHSDRIASLRKQLDELSKNRHDEELRLVHHQKDVAHREGEVARLKSDLVSIEERIAKVDNELTELSAQRLEFQTSLETNTKAREEKQNALAERRAEEVNLREQRDQLNDKLSACRSELASHEERSRGITREIERLISAISEGEATLAQRRSEIAEGAAAIEAGGREIEVLKEQLSTAVAEAESGKSRQQDVQQRYQSLTDQVRELEAGIRTLRRVHDQAVNEKHESELALTQQRERLAHMESDIVDKYQVDLAVVANEYLQESFDANEAKANVEDLRSKVEKLGGVNIDAIEECEEIRQRHEFLAAQSADLEASIDSLQRAIHKINRVSRERFRETFHAINERFQKLFPKLFRGGKAELILTEEDNILESGVEIVAQPPGKKLQSVTLLSGGEKALTAVALIFGMFLVRPSPFCLLDEVDAPLDDANIDRFNQMIRDMTGYAQFILITHNKRTMELADTLYGVTMEEPGISKIVSVRLNREDVLPEGEKSVPAVA